MRKYSFKQANESGFIMEHLIIGNKKAACAAFLKKQVRSCTSSSCQIVTIVDGVKPVLRIEWTAHAQCQRRNIHQLVGRHFFFGFLGLFGFLRLYDKSLFRPFCLASLCRTGYRKE